MAMQAALSIPEPDSVKCSKCGEFRKWDGGKGWHGRQCPECTREYNREWARQWRADNPERHSEYQRQWYAANLEREREKLRERMRQWRADNPERYRQWYAANLEREREKLRERMRQRYAANPERYRKAAREYHAAHPEASRKSNRNRRARKADGICEHGPGCFDQADRKIKRRRCAIPGCRRRKHIQADHIIPLWTGGLDCRDNHQLLCRHHNTSKGATDPIVYARRNGMLF